MAVRAPKGSTGCGSEIGHEKGWDWVGGRWAPHGGLSLGGGTGNDSHLWLETLFPLVPLPVGTCDLVTVAKTQAGSPCTCWVLGFEVAGLEAFTRVGNPSMDTCGLGRGPLLLSEIRIRPQKSPHVYESLPADVYSLW